MGLIIAIWWLNNVVPITLSIGLYLPQWPVDIFLPDKTWLLILAPNPGTGDSGISDPEISDLGIIASLTYSREIWNAEMPNENYVCCLRYGSSGSIDLYFIGCRPHR